MQISITQIIRSQGIHSYWNYVFNFVYRWTAIWFKSKKVERQGVDLVIAFDTSTSMDAIDVKPSRIEKAKYEIGKLIQGLKGDRVSLIVFAGTSHLYLPLTTDYEADNYFCLQLIQK